MEDTVWRKCRFRECTGKDRRTGARLEGEDLRKSMVKVSLTRILEKKGQLTVLIARSCFTPTTWAI